MRVGIAAKQDEAASVTGTTGDTQRARNVTSIRNDWSAELKVDKSPDHYMSLPSTDRELSKRGADMCELTYITGESFPIKGTFRAVTVRVRSEKDLPVLSVDLKSR